MMRHYSKVIIAVPDDAADEPELKIWIDCDVCGKMEFSTHIAHYGTLVRTLSLHYRDMGGDDGFSEPMGVPLKELEKAVSFLDRAFPEWKAERLRKHHG